MISEIDYGGVPTEIYRRLRDRILRGSLKVGEQIKIDAVAKEFGVSIIPVREAMRILAADRLVELPPRRSPVVCGLAPDDVLEISRIRLALEPLALEAAVPAARNEDLDACQELLGEAERPNLDGWEKVDLNRRFHLALYAPCGMPRLLKIISDQYDGLTLCAHFLVVRSSSHGTDSRAEHVQLLDACRRRDVVSAMRCLKAHLDASRDRLEKAFSVSVSAEE